MLNNEFLIKQKFHQNLEQKFLIRIPPELAKDDNGVDDDRDNDGDIHDVSGGDNVDKYDDDGKG